MRIQPGDKEFVVDGAHYPDVCCQDHEDVGFQSDCFGCYTRARLTEEHIRAVRAHDQGTIDAGLVPLRFFVDDAHRDAWQAQQLRDDPSV